MHETHIYAGQVARLGALNMIRSVRLERASGYMAWRIEKGRETARPVFRRIAQIEPQ